MYLFCNSLDQVLQDTWSVSNEMLSWFWTSFPEDLYGDGDNHLPTELIFPWRTRILHIYHIWKKSQAQVTNKEKKHCLSLLGLFLGLVVAFTYACKCQTIAQNTSNYSSSLNCIFSWNFDKFQYLIKIVIIRS